METLCCKIHYTENVIACENGINIFKTDVSNREDKILFKKNRRSGGSNPVPLTLTKIARVEMVFIFIHLFKLQQKIDIRKNIVFKITIKTLVESKSNSKFIIETYN